MAALEEALKATQGKRLRLIATDGVFSMDGFIAKLEAVCDLAERYDALVMVDDSHATGFVGATGRGSHEHCGVMGRVHILTGTLGKALGGASGGYTASSRVVVDLLRQRSRPYLFSNSVAPAIVGAGIAVLDTLSHSTALRDRVMANALRFREAMTAAGFAIKPGIHPIVPVMLGDARLAGDMAAALLERGIYVIGFSFPVVPKGEARIRVQLSAQHTDDDIDRAVAAFTEVGRSLGVVR
jgi:glycine C-acetyltransferase